MRLTTRIASAAALVAMAAGATGTIASAPSHGARARTIAAQPDYMEPRPAHAVKSAALGAGSTVAKKVVTPPRLQYQGGVGGIGVETAPKVYIVFYGSQWGAATTPTGSTTTTFTKDPKGEAPYVQKFLSGLYGATDTWSTSTTQYCQGIAARAACTASSAYVTHPAANPVAGVWYLNTEAAPAAPSLTKLRAVAVLAATHFANTTPKSNTSNQYVIALPTGIVPAGFKTQYCAFHDWGYSQPTGPVAYTNLPYLPDAGYACGQNIVNPGAAGLLDGVSIVEGHEYAETVSDQFPAGGWLDASGSENGDECAWITAGHGAVSNITLTTGKFAVQSLWSNNFNSTGGGCVTAYVSPTNQH